MEIVLYAMAALAGIYLVSKLLEPAIKVKAPKIGIFGAQTIYNDEDGGKLLKSDKYDLQGKPDYIFQTLISGAYIPVELKSTRLKEDQLIPHQGDLMQLAAYFLIIEDLYGKRPKEGRLIYKNRMFIIKNTRSLRRQLNGYLKEMRQMIKTGKGEADPSFPKCRNCVCRGTVCEWNKEG